MPESQSQPIRSGTMSDVLPPEVSPHEGEIPQILVEAEPEKESIAELKLARAPRKFRPEWRRALKILAVLVVTLFLGFGVMRFSFLEERVSQTMAVAKQVIGKGKSLRSSPAIGSVVSDNGETSASLEEASSTSFSSLLRRASLADIWKLFTRGGETIGSFQKTLEDYKRLTDESTAFLKKVPGIFLDAQTGGPLPMLRRIQKQVASLEANNAELTSSLGSVKETLPIDFSEYVAMGKSLNRMSDLLDLGINWLEKPHRIILAFQNSSEMRPSGGFLGSYAEISMASGTVTSIQVRDITEADKEFSELIIPPPPLQYITKNWRAADANWFFDFPRSASQVISFLQKSDIYKASSTRFDGFIGISPRVLEDIIETTGPIELKDRKITLTEKNFLRVIQEDVVTKRSQSVTAPKSILGDVVDVLRERLINLTPENRLELTRLFNDWIRYKDIQIYMDDTEFQTAIRFFGADGSVASSSPTLNSDYLALVDSTIGGEKTNYVMDRTITFRAQIEESGRVVHSLTILRDHQGDKEKEAWYKAANRNYLRVLVPPGSQVLGASGFEERAAANRSYSKDYLEDPTLASYQSTFKTVLGIPALRTFEESGKTGIAGWTRTEAGKQTKTVLEYEHRLPQKPDIGVPYHFIFEKQAGTEGDYSFEVDAPVGYQFKENKLPIFEYKTEDIPGRVVIDLTLERI